ncbi:phosphate transport system substrate-binding protein [Kaistella treverensis]|uniref:Phosphate transport system substrate-binding protein n=1 Tax=Kaistella treverensis TaxID=631455 RepID=A0A1I3MCY5_9FLAO|nr:phosphate transport system substrate-binding protein [Kaistella treverensis]
MKIKNLTLFAAFFAFLISCKKSEYVVDTPQQGTVTLAVDESFRSVSEALTSRYMALYPNTKINLVFKKEDFAFLDLLEGKVRVAVMSRELTEREKKAFKDKVDLDLQPAPFAADAVVFIVPKDSPRDSISINELHQLLKSSDEKVIFDGTNSSNLNFVAQKLKTTPDQLKYSIISGNKNIAEKLGSLPGKIGAISLNTLSRPYDPEAEALRNSVKILKVSEGKQAYAPTLQNLSDKKYPFSRILYFLTNEAYFGLGNGFIRFSCTQLGQIVVSKEGLQPYYLFNREVQMR